MACKHIWETGLICSLYPILFWRFNEEMTVKAPHYIDWKKVMLNANMQWIIAIHIFICINIENFYLLNYTFIAATFYKNLGVIHQSNAFIILIPSHFFVVSLKCLLFPFI